MTAKSLDVKGQGAPAFNPGAGVLTSSLRANHFLLGRTSILVFGNTSSPRNLDLFIYLQIRV